MSSLEYIGKFIGPEEVIEIEEDGKTPLGDSVFKVKTKFESFVNDNGEEDVATRIYTKATLDATISDQKSDWNTFRDSKFRHIVDKITELAIEYGISGEEMDPLLMSVGRNFATMIDKAVYKKWFGDTKDFVPGGGSMHGFTLLAAHNELHLNEGIDSNGTGKGPDSTD